MDLPSHIKAQSPPLSCARLPLWACWTVAIVGLAVGLLLAPFGIDNVDEAYMSLNAMHPETVTVAPLFAFTGHAVGALVGYDMINFRIFSLLTLDVAVIIAALYYYRRTHRLRMALLLTGLCAMLPLLKKESATAIYGWDSLATLMVTVCALLVVELIRRPRRLMVVLCGVCAALTTLVRLPSGGIMLIPLALIAVLPGFGLKRRVADMCVYIVCYISILLLGLVVMYGSPQAFVATYQANQMGAHPIADILYQQAIKLIDVAMLACLFYFAYSLLRTWRSWLAVFAVGAFLVSGLCLNAIQLYEFSLEMVYVGMFAFVLVYIYISSERDFTTAVTLLALAACGYATACGSNLGLIKYTTFSLYPLAFIFCRRGCDTAFAKVVAVFMAVVIVFAAYKNLRATHFDVAVRECTATVDIPSLRGLRTSEQRAGYLQRVWQERLRLDPAQSAHIIVLGASQSRYMLEYLFDAPNAALRNDWSADNSFANPRNLEFVRSTIASHPDVMVIVINDASWRDSQVGRYVESALRLVSESDDFLIYR